MFDVSVKDQKGAAVGSYKLSAGRLGGCVRYQLLKDVVVAYEAHKRVGTASVKTRAMVAGSTKKIYRQKGTGRARHGSKKANLFRGGGVVHGPTPRDYGGSPSKRTRRVAAASALLSKFRDGEVFLLDRLSMAAPKTADFESILGALGVQDTVLVVLPREAADEEGRNVLLSGRNIPGVAILSAWDVNARDLLVSRNVLFSKQSLSDLLDRVGAEGGATASEGDS